MSDYRRCYEPGGTYFFTVVTHQRRPILNSDVARKCLRLAMERERAKRTFEIIAFVLLPDHLHTIWTLPIGDSNYSLRWAKIKEDFTRAYLAEGGVEGNCSQSRQQRRERGIWQQRYWEHNCRDEDDLKRCVDYIHWNPVKHKLVSCVRDYPWSSFHKYVTLGEYEVDWGGENPCPRFSPPE